MLQSKNLILADCLDGLKSFGSSTCDMIYLDPPFFTNKKHSSSTRDGTKHFSFTDVWYNAEDYVDFMHDRLLEMRRVLKSSGTIFFHGDHNNTHLARLVLDEVFGVSNFVSEIIWHYKRWSNPKRGLLQQHQNILVYSKTPDFKWNTIFTDYSPTTNIDQIMQKRGRDERGKAIYQRDASGNTVYADEKRGVPLGDVWEIPFLNPKAKERTGYPTQKPILLLEKIIGLATDEGDLVLDPFCGSGTTLVAAKLMDRKYVGLDISPDAIHLSESRLAQPIRTESGLLKKGIESYENKDPWIEGHLVGFSYVRVRRNTGIDALINEKIDGKPCFIRVQRQGESLGQAARALMKATANKGDVQTILIKTEDSLFPEDTGGVTVLVSPALQFRDAAKKSQSKNGSKQVVRKQGQLA